MVSLAFDTAAKIRQMIYLRAFVLFEEDDNVEVVDVRIGRPIAFKSSFSTAPAPDNSGRYLFLECYGIADVDFDFSSVMLEVDVKVGNSIRTLIHDKSTIDRQFTNPKYTVMGTWNRLIADERIKRVIDIGGRARSGVSRKGSLPGKEILVADIIKAPDVDFLVDVHELSAGVDEKFDAFMSIATFEHLLMPWKAAVEINKVLNKGGVGLVVTHQTIGCHDIPWDFFRYSDNAWKGIFNQYTGYEIVDSGMTLPCMIIPRRWQQQYERTEHAVGYMTSSVVVRKISDASLDWPVQISSITSETYPR